MWCSSANRIKEENKVFFLTKEAAQAAGYTLAGNCQ
jgi:methylphosphotriester-DNA--protein-cysteine methyltransferase